MRARVYALSFCAQAVQIGAVPALIALRLHAGGFSVTVVGMVAAAPWLAVLLLSQVVPGLLARHGYVPVNAAALWLSGIAVAMIMLTSDPLLIFTANFCLGAGLILRWIACDSWIIALAPDAMRGRAIGVHETLMGCGIAAGPLIIALCGDRTAAPLLACLGLLLVAACALFSVNVAPRAPAPDDPAPAAGLRYFSLMACAAFSAGFIETASVSFLPVLGLQALPPRFGILALAAFTIGGTVLQFPIGYLADALGIRLAQLSTAAVIVASGVVFGVLGHERLALLASLFALGGAAGAMNTLAVIEAGAAASAHRVAASAARIALAHTVGSIVGPPAVGMLVAVAGPKSFALGFAVIGLAFCVARLLLRRQRSGVNTTLPTAVFEAGT